MLNRWKAGQHESSKSVLNKMVGEPYNAADAMATICDASSD